MRLTTEVEVDDDELIDYIQTNKRVNEVFSDSEIKEYCADNFKPNDVFPDSELIAWAEANGFVSQGA